MLTRLFRRLQMAEAAAEPAVRRNYIPDTLIVGAPDKEQCAIIRTAVNNAIMARLNGPLTAAYLSIKTEQECRLLFVNRMTDLMIDELYQADALLEDIEGDPCANWELDIDELMLIRQVVDLTCASLKMAYVTECCELSRHELKRLEVYGHGLIFNRCTQASDFRMPPLPEPEAALSHVFGAAVVLGHLAWLLAVVLS